MSGSKNENLKQSQVQQAIEAKWAPYYENTKEAIIKESEKNVFKKIKEKVESIRQDTKNLPTLLDLGTGTGRVALFFAQAGWNVLAIDYTQGALKFVQSRAEKMGLKIKTAKIDIIKNKFPEEKFDLITAAWVMPFVPEQHIEEVMKKITAAVKPKGYFCGHFFGPQHPWRNKENIYCLTKKEISQFFLPAFKKYEIEENIEEILAASGEKVPNWHEFTVHAQMSKAGPCWSTRQMLKGLYSLFSESQFKWRGDASKNAAWVWFSDKSSRDEALNCIQERLKEMIPKTTIAAKPARSGERFAVLLKRVSKKELQKCANYQYSPAEKSHPGLGSNAN